MKVISYLLLVISLLLAISGCTSTGKAAANETLLTDDGISLAYSYWEGQKPLGIILLHMLNRDRHDYDKIAARLNEKGFHVISIDSRGHGESEGSWQDFTQTDFNAMMLDVRAAKDFLANKGVERFAIIGASIGANTALRYSITDPTVLSLVLLSPGLDYRGVRIEEAAKILKAAVLLVASKEDEYSYLTVQKLHELESTKMKLVLYENAGHGTQMLANEQLEEEIMEWVSG